MDTINGSIQKLKEIKECCSARDVLWYLVFLGFAVNYMIRINLNIALVSMVKPRPKSNLALTSECLYETGPNGFVRSTTLGRNIEHLPVENATIKTTIVPSTTTSYNKSDAGFNTTRNILTITTTLPNFERNSRSNISSGGISTNSSAAKNPNLFDWNEKVQGTVLGSFYWLHWLSQIPGGLLAGKYGTKTVFGLSNFAGVVLCFGIPLCAHWGAWYLIVLRTLQGFATGFAWPAMHHMTARWIPPNERSKFVTAYLGSSVGAALTYPICGFIIDRWGWEFVFYFCGVLGVLWFTVWWFLVYDSPAEHPRISDNEREYIVKTLGQSVAHKTVQVPWLKILTSVPVAMNLLAQLGGVWGLFTLMTHAPTYFKFIHGWDIKATGLLSGMPHLVRMLWAYIFSLLGDYLLKSNKMSRSNVRKLATAVCCCGQGVFMLLLAYSGCDRTTAIIYLTAAVGLHGAVSTGPLASVVDVSPNYASVILGVINTVVACVGFLTPVVVGNLTYQNQTVKQWQKVFWIASGMLFSSGIIYTIFSKSEVQPWNSQEAKTLPETELMIVKKEEEALRSGKRANETEETTKIVHSNEYNK